MTEKASTLMAKALVAVLKRDCNAQSTDDPTRLCASETHRLARLALREYEKREAA